MNKQELKKTVEDFNLIITTPELVLHTLKLIKEVNKDLNDVEKTTLLFIEYLKIQTDLTFDKL